MKQNLRNILQSRDSIMSQRAAEMEEKKHRSFLRRKEIEDEEEEWREMLNRSIDSKLKIAKSYREAKRRERRFELILKNKQKKEEHDKNYEEQLLMKVLDPAPYHILTD